MIIYFLVLLLKTHDPCTNSQEECTPEAKLVVEADVHDIVFYLLSHRISFLSSNVTLFFRLFLHRGHILLEHVISITKVKEYKNTDIRLSTTTWIDSKSFQTQTF